MPKVTIIMPSLNVANYIKQCMDSVLHQTLQDIEVLAVDAGSTDGTLEILQEYARNDSRVRVIVSDKRSYGYQMNLGLEQAAGEYIGIVETDDIVASNMFEVLYEVAVSQAVDYVKASGCYMCQLPNGELWNLPMAPILTDATMFGQIISPFEMPELLVRDIFLWLGIYRREFLRDIRFNETAGAAFQDQGFLLQTIGGARRAIYLENAFYYYRQDNSGSSVRNHNGFKYLAEEYTCNEKYLEAKTIEWYSAFYERLLNQSIGRFSTMAVSGAFWDDAKEYMDIVREKLSYALQKGYLTENNLDKMHWRVLNSFIENPVEVFDSFSQEYEEHLTEGKRLFQYLSQDKSLIFGCGKWGKFLHVLLENKRHGSVFGFCDNQESLWGTQLQGKPVISPTEAIQKYAEHKFIIANKWHADDIREQLKAAGIPDEQILNYTAGVDLLLLQLNVE